jgi:hypothetical protein
VSTDNVQRFAKLLDQDHLEQMLSGGRWVAEPLATAIPLPDVYTAVATVAGMTGSSLDSNLVEPLHRSLPLTRREGADTRVWQWLCVTQFPGLVWRRWDGGEPSPEALTQALTYAMSTRFLGKSSLNGISRNTMARLWWTAEHLREGEDYDLARQALSNQDMFQNIFERFFGIYPAAARACLDRFDGCNEAEIRKASRWLQQCASTTILEGLDESEVAAILDESLAAA